MPLSLAVCAWTQGYLFKLGLGDLVSVGMLMPKETLLATLRPMCLKHACVHAQGYLTKLGLGNLVSVGMLSVNVLVSSAMQVSAFDFLPYLEVTTGIPSGEQ